MACMAVASMTLTDGIADSASSPLSRRYVREAGSLPLSSSMVMPARLSERSAVSLLIPASSCSAC